MTSVAYALDLSPFPYSSHWLAALRFSPTTMHSATAAIPPSQPLLFIPHYPYPHLLLSPSLPPPPSTHTSTHYPIRCRPVRSESVAEVLLEDFLNRILLVYGGRIPNNWTTLDEGHSHHSHHPHGGTHAQHSSSSL